jgi:hypothetical protein
MNARMHGLRDGRYRPTLDGPDRARQRGVAVRGRRAESVEWNQ